MNVLNAEILVELFTLYQIKTQFTRNLILINSSIVQLIYSNETF
jgi:hypothetical protein